MQTGRWPALVLLFLLLPTARADWLQPGYDAARTGNTPDAGPAWDDIVFQLHFDVNPHPKEPVIVGNLAYVGYMLPGNTGTVLAAIDLGNASVRVLVDDFPGGYIQAWVSDGAAMYVLTDGGWLSAVDLPSGAVRWQKPIAPGPDGFDPAHQQQPLGRSDFITNCFYGNLAVVDDIVYVACDTREVELYVAAYDVREGNPLWEALGGTPEAPTAGQRGNLGDAQEEYLQERTFPWGQEYRVTGVTVAGELLVVSGYILEARDGELALAGQGRVTYPQYHVLDRFNGERLWMVGEGFGDDGQSRMNTEGTIGNVPPPATMAHGQLLVELRQLQAWDPADPGGPANVAVIRSEDAQLEGDPGSGFAVAQERVYATSLQGVHLLDPSLNIQQTRHFADEEIAPGPLAVAGNGLLYFATGAPQAGPLGTHARVQALDARTLATVWSHSFTANVRFAIADGLLVAWDSDGTFTVLGQTGTSPRPVARASTSVPAPGDLVEVDLSASGPGLFGNVTHYRADWGDGTSTDWQAEPLLEHRYSSLSNFEARFFVKNAANQTASVTQTFVVGGQPELNFLQRQFAADRQNTSFFVLGLLATLVAALWGVLQIRRSHNRLARELRELEERIEARRGAEVDEAIRAFRQRAQQLFAERKIDHGQYLVLLGRVQEVQRGLRMAVVDERLAFLPHGMVKRLEAMLGDAQVTGWERHHFMEALQAEPLLTGEQRAAVRTLVDAWFAADQGKPSA